VSLALGESHRAGGGVSPSDAVECALTAPRTGFAMGHTSARDPSAHAVCAGNSIEPGLPVGTGHCHHIGGRVRNDHVRRLPISG